MGSSKRFRSRSPEDSVHHSKSHEVSNNTSPPVLNELLEKLTQMASSLATLDNRLGVLESNQRNQTERSNEQTARSATTPFIVILLEKKTPNIMIDCR